ncbi:MAG: acetyl-CoA carboxylase carboxyl transferase subunit alpha, partial [Pseudomonadota bacterium]|nr:acetyl-CoA carboxylase carboxyl transferase subunit alpha [Pseudomonadota bacterium]
ILWKDFTYAPKAAEILHLTADDLLKYHLIDAIIPEPVGGAHRFPTETMKAVSDAVQQQLDHYRDLPPDELVRLRQDKFTRMTRGAEKAE